MFNNDEKIRYSRHILLSEIGVLGQQKLNNAKVLIVGVGGLGSPVAQYLAASGVGTLGIIDNDVVDLSNLHRQIIHNSMNVGLAKTESAKMAIKGINPNVVVNTYKENFTSQNAIRIASEYDVIIDGADNFPTRYLCNDVSVLLGKPNVHGSIFKFTGQVSVFNYSNKSPCYRCLYPTPPEPDSVPDCATAGVLGVLPGVIGVIMATEAIKIILDIGEVLAGRILLYSALEMKFREIKLSKDTHCPICKENPTLTELIDYEEFCKTKNKNDTFKITKNEMYRETTVEELNELRKNNIDHILIDVRERDENALAKIDGALLIPLSEFEQRVNEIPDEGRVIIHCHHGGRSARACLFLMQQGYKNLENLKGGIDDWSQKIDSSVIRY